MHIRPVNQRIERGISGIFGPSGLKTADIINENADPHKIIDVATDELQFIENGSVLRPLEGNASRIMSVQPEINFTLNARKKAREHVFTSSIEDFYIAAVSKEGAGTREQLRLRLDAINLRAMLCEHPCGMPEKSTSLNPNGVRKAVSQQAGMLDEVRTWGGIMTFRPLKAVANAAQEIMEPIVFHCSLTTKINHNSSELKIRQRF
jgi:hypothetical protein